MDQKTLARMQLAAHHHIRPDGKGGFGQSGGGAQVTVEVCNRGTEPVARGLAVSVYAGDPPGALGCQAETLGTLVPGTCQEVACDWATPGAVATVIVDDRGMRNGANLECREDNNALVLTGIDCP